MTEVWVSVHCELKRTEHKNTTCLVCCLEFYIGRTEIFRHNVDSEALFWQSTSPYKAIKDLLTLSKVRPALHSH